MLIKCQNKHCKRLWDYEGKKKEGFYTSCPDCKHSVKIKKYEAKK